MHIDWRRVLTKVINILFGIIGEIKVRYYFFFFFDIRRQDRFRPSDDFLFRLS